MGQFPSHGNKSTDGNGFGTPGLIDLGGSDPTTGFVEMAVRELGAERIVFGSDAGGRSFASQIAKVQGADVTDEQRNLIFRDNLKRLLSPILQAKGIKP